MMNDEDKKLLERLKERVESIQKGFESGSIPAEQYKEMYEAIEDTLKEMEDISELQRP